MYDAIIVGARVAGSATALLIARRSYRVLLVDRASFPSDTLSTHLIQLPGGAALKRWGLLDKVIATDPGKAAQVRFDMEELAVVGQYPFLDGVNAVYSPRRYVLDTILLAEAAEAGVEVRQEFTVQELLWENGRVVGIRGRTKTGESVIECARIVIGADGRYSLIARTVAAPTYHEHPSLTCGYYSYWSDVPTQGGEIYLRGKRFISLWPTNDHLTLIYTAWPAAEFSVFRADIERNFLETLDLVPALAARVRQGQRAERFRGSAEMANFYRKPFGPGWALVGDAGYQKDPITAMGISDAFRDAELLAAALDDGFAGRRPLAAALAHYEQRRNAASRPFYEFTLETAQMKPLTVGQRELLQALPRHPTAASQFFGVLTGVVQPATFFRLQNLFQILGVQGLTKMVLNTVFQPRQKGERSGILLPSGRKGATHHK
ncbi:NAD(P)/FAD-dependent oxidoreductase [Ktedonobacter robiniae]|uniref:FAD-dependent oxidoreductase n=1 Tax=Ktedonobacter robiniae TaxID=2778365 RepID=A0ABQ3UY33_9CHLR|nr:NAD(P)/FAD-dependent oxidoreductase [Ktedonobacter robiniae]GHO57577.1 FAD-dependent oxidoreductase [Ktedonobacter robiniae]